ncbi:TetR/AcrR family transcriptional regulator [Eubacteriaceae bacterium ES2]|nr:TetR/AcrR family transcriptional regulator [Eubacteriaceae bacterium ES2]
MSEEILLSNRQLKNEETRKKLLDAMEHIMEKYDYNTLTIRNLCKVSGVAYGSFYNLFESKEDFLRYYLTHDFVEYMENYYSGNDEYEQMNALEKCVDLFVTCAKYNENKGLLFISGFYSPYNYSLSPLGNDDKEYSFTPLVSMSIELLNRAKDEGLLPKEIDCQRVVDQFCYLFNGITFNWCISRGKFPMVQSVREVFGIYLKLNRV